jgi:phosphate transport system substrate-binding protein
VGLAACSGNQAAKPLNGAGATFPAKIYQSWFADLAQSGGSQVNYQAVGSGSGRRAFLDQTVDFAASDDPIKAIDREKVEQGVVQIPMVGGTIAFGYNKPGCDLKLTQQQAVQVAIGKIKDWGDLGCEAGTITWVHRSMVLALPKPSQIPCKRFHLSGPSALVSLFNGQLGSVAKEILVLQV